MYCASLMSVFLQFCLVEGQNVVGVIVIASTTLAKICRCMLLMGGGNDLLHLNVSDNAVSPCLSVCF